MAPDQEDLIDRLVIAANVFISDNMRDRFTAGNPVPLPDGKTWEVPVILTYPKIGSIGRVGSIVINADSETILSHTPVLEMYEEGAKLYHKYQGAIKLLSQ